MRPPDAPPAIAIDLRRALLGEALHTIEREGVDGLTLRAIGTTLGVSRSALYRHFADKASLLAAVAREGFGTLRRERLDAWERGHGGREGFEAMGVAYVRFAIAHQAHYRVMFGGFLDERAPDPALVAETASAFQTLVEAVTALQKVGLLRRDDPTQVARFVWAVVHGIARLGIDGQLRGADADPIALVRYANECLRTGIARA